MKHTEPASPGRPRPLRRTQDVRASRLIAPSRRVLASARSILFALLIASVASACVLPAHAAVDPLPFRDRAEEVRFQNLTRQLRCLVCQNESLNDSAAPLAADLRRDVFEQMRAGRSDAEIKAWLTARYSDFVLYDPPLRAGTWLLWFGPLLIVLAGGVAIAGIVRRRARAVAATPVRAANPTDTGDDW
jgi:cytochrome c-type biogenesis protein CcmH